MGCLSGIREQTDWRSVEWGGDDTCVERSKSWVQKLSWRPHWGRCRPDDGHPSQDSRHRIRWGRVCHELIWLSVDWRRASACGWEWGCVRIDYDWRLWRRMSRCEESLSRPPSRPLWVMSPVFLEKFSWNSLKNRQNSPKHSPLKKIFPILGKIGFYCILINKYFGSYFRLWKFCQFWKNKINFHKE